MKYLRVSLTLYSHTETNKTFHFHRHTKCSSAENKNRKMFTYKDIFDEEYF